jgi:molecular chaperone DnaJ
MARDYYEILEVTREETADGIKKSYRRLAVKYHPDKNPGDKAAEEKFKELGHAYEILSDPQKRAAYDQYGHEAFDPRARARGGGFGGGAGGGFHDPFDIFREVFGGGAGAGIFESMFGGGGDPTGPQRGDDLRYDLQLSLEEAALGCEKEISVTKLDACESCAGSGAEPGSKLRTCGTCGGRGQVLTSRGIFSIAQTCPHCKGAGRILEKPCRKCAGNGKAERTSKIKLRIPAGVESGSRLRSQGNGEAGARGGHAGDLYVFLSVKPHEIFVREGDDLLCEVPVSFVQATLGDEIEVPTLTGRATIKIPAGTQPGTLLRLKGRGVKNLQGHGHGDLHVRVQVEVPAKLNTEQKQKLQEFAALCDGKEMPLKQGFFEKAKKFFQ